MAFDAIFQVESRYRSAALLLKSLSTSNTHFCQMDCSTSAEASPVCGTDNATYRSKCELQQTACRKTASANTNQPLTPIAVQYRGVCVESKKKNIKKFKFQAQ